MIRQPIQVYNNWSAYDELSDNVELTEELALRQLDEILRLRKHGARFDYYLMDAFWYAEDGGYRTWRKPHWPDGPDRWIDKCLQNGIKPGLWVANNGLCKLKPLPEWEDSVTERRGSMCMFAGGFFPHFIETLQQWYDRGVRMYKFDFADFGAATPEIARTHLPSEIFELNVAAMRTALMVFREKNPEVVLMAYNGFGGDIGTTANPFAKNVDEKWLAVFDSLYCGDPRPADVPCMDFWRSKDIYSDHQVRAYEFSNIPLERIDSSGFMIGTTGTCYKRGLSAWKGMLVLMYARGGWVNKAYGNMELLQGADADWFAKVQSMYMKLQVLGRTHTFGGVPGKAEPYGFASVSDSGSLYTVVNPSQSIADIELPAMSRCQGDMTDGRVLFSDAGFVPRLGVSTLTLGPEQMAVVGYGAYASAEFDLGLQEDVIIPDSIEPISAEFEASETNTMTATIDPSLCAAGSGARLRIAMQQFSKSGVAGRISGGAPPNGTLLDRILRISVAQNGRELPVELNYDKAIWSGLSWAVGEVKCSDIAPNEPVTIACRSDVKDEMRLEGRAFTVVYRGG